MNTFLRIDINLFATLYLAIVFYLAYRRLDHENAFNRLFFRGCIIIMIMTFFEALTCIMNNNPLPMWRWVSTILHLFLFALPPLITYHWFLLANTLTLHGDVSNMKGKWPLLIPVAIVVIITLLSPALHLVYYIDESGVYHRGPLFPVELIVSYSYLALGFCLLIKRRKRLIDIDFRFLTLFCLLPMIGGLVQGLVYGVLLMWASSACALAIMYMYLQERMIQTDYLTGAWTRHSLELYIAQKLKDSEKQCFGMVYVDIDNLKYINDHYGHSEGDVAIRAATTAIKSVLRKGDAIARFGGDEFAILLEINTREALDAVLKRIEDSVQRYNATSGKAYELSLSFGADLFTQVRDDNVDTIVGKVDQLMYANKRCKKRGADEDGRREADSLEGLAHDDLLGHDKGNE